MANFKIAYIPCGEKDYEQNKYYYYIYDENKTKRSKYGTCNWTIRACAYRQCKTEKTAKKWLTFYQNLYK